MQSYKLRNLQYFDSENSATADATRNFSGSQTMPVMKLLQANHPAAEKA
jgi:hypothetical protein